MGRVELHENGVRQIGALFGEQGLRPLDEGCIALPVFLIGFEGRLIGCAGGFTRGGRGGGIFQENEGAGRRSHKDCRDQNSAPVTQYPVHEIPR